MSKDTPKVHNIQMNTMFKFMYFVNSSNKRLKHSRLAQVKMESIRKDINLAQRILGQDAVRPSEYTNLLNRINNSINNEEEFQKYTRGVR